MLTHVKGVNLGLVGAFAVYKHTAKAGNLGPNGIFAVCLIHGKEPFAVLGTWQRLPPGTRQRGSKGHTAKEGTAKH